MLWSCRCEWSFDNLVNGNVPCQTARLALTFERCELYLADGKVPFFSLRARVKLPECQAVYSSSSSRAWNAWRFASMACGRLESGCAWFRVTQSRSNPFEPVGSWRAPYTRTSVSVNKTMICSREPSKQSPLPPPPPTPLPVLLFFLCSVRIFLVYFLFSFAAFFLILSIAFFFSFFSYPPLDCSVRFQF